MRRFLASVALSSAALSFVVWGCSDFSEDLESYYRDSYSTMEELKAAKCNSAKDGMDVIFNGNNKSGSSVYTCSDGYWIGDKKDSVKYEKPTSSSSGKSSSSSKKSSSSSSKNSSASSSAKSSSSKTTDGKVSSSSSVEIVPTSSIIIVPTTTGLGTCMGTKGETVVGKGEQMTFKFSFNKDAVSGFSISEVASATYVWNYGAGLSDGTENKATSAKVMFAESGDPIVSVTVSVAGETETVQCPIHVNGAPITGCVCAPTAELVDYSTGATGAWEVTGCTSTAAIAGYKWSVSGAAGTLTENGTSATYAFSAPGVATATVTVSNAEETNKVFECMAVEGSNGPKNNYDVATATQEQLSSLQDGVLYTITHNYPQALQLSGNANECTVVVNGKSEKISYSTTLQPAPSSPTTLKASNCGTLKVGGY